MFNQRLKSVKFTDKRVRLTTEVRTRFTRLLFFVSRKSLLNRLSSWTCRFLLGSSRNSVTQVLCLGNVLCTADRDATCPGAESSQKDGVSERLLVPTTLSQVNISYFQTRSSLHSCSDDLYSYPRINSIICKQHPSNCVKSGEETDLMFIDHLCVNRA